MPDVAEKFVPIKDEPDQKLYKEIDTYPNDKGKMEDHIIWFRKGKAGSGTYGIRRTVRTTWITHDETTAETFGELAKTHVLHMSTTKKQLVKIGLALAKTTSRTGTGGS